MQSDDNSSFLTQFFQFLDSNQSGILTAVVVVGALLIMVLYFIKGLAKVFSWGSYRDQPAVALVQDKPLRHVAADLFVKVIDDFRHLLALIIITIFAIGLVWSLYKTGSERGQISDALQAVMGTLGGLVGSIIGYYFGESAATKASASSGDSAPPPTTMGEPEQIQPAMVPPIEDAPEPTVACGDAPIQPAPEPAGRGAAGSPRPAGNATTPEDVHE